ASGRRGPWSGFGGRRPQWRGQGRPRAIRASPAQARQIPPAPGRKNPPPRPPAQTLARPQPRAWGSRFTAPPRPWGQWWRMLSSIDPARRAPEGPATGKVGTPWFSSLLRGLTCACPRCGQGWLFTGYIRLQPNCKNCGLEFEPYRADDAPAYFTILIVGHI